MVVKIKPNFIQHLLKVIIIITLSIEPAGVFSQNKDLVKVTIESIKCIKPSTGQDVYTKFLFKGIELALTAAKALATAGASLTVDAAIEIAKTTAKSALKSAAEITVKNQDFYKSGKQKLIDAVKKQGDRSPAMSFVIDGVQTYLTYTSLEGLFNKVYGQSPDDLYIKVNGNKIWPSGDGAIISSQQNIMVGAQYIFEKSQGLNIQLMEYDWGSGDDDMGGWKWTYHPNFMGNYRVVDQLIEHEGEGSVYLITFRVESVLKHRYINEIVNSMWDQTVDGKPINTIAFGASEIINGGDGVTWKIVDVDKIQFCKNNNPYLNITFLSETSAIGSYINQQGGGVQTTYSAKKRPWDHLSAKNIIGSSWDYYWDPAEPPILMEIGDGTINFPQLNDNGVTWKFRARDYMYLNNLAQGSNMFLFFESENTFKGKSWDGVTIVYGKRRTGASSQQQNQQTSQNQFPNNIIGTSWKYSEGGAGTYSFNIGNGTIDNFSYPGVGWEGATWTVIDNNKIQIRATNGALMDLTFRDSSAFSGFAWNNRNNAVNGTIIQPQYLQPQTLQHNYLNNIVGTSWTFSDPAWGEVSFSFGQDKLINVNPAGTFWDAVTWRVSGSDTIELRTNQGVTMNLMFANKQYFSGFSWYNRNTLATGTMNQQQQQYQQQQQTFQHQFSNNLNGTLWTFYNPDGSSFYISFSPNIVNAPPGYGWEGVTWKYTGNDMIRFTAPNGAVMDLSFLADYKFNGFLWNDPNKKIAAIKN